MTRNNHNTYKALKQKYNDTEIAENFYVSKEMTQQEKEVSDKEIRDLRKKLREEMSPEDRIYSGILMLRYQIRNYVNSQSYQTAKTVSYYLKEYMHILGKKQKDLCIDLAIHKTRLSRILNGREKLNLQLAYRLEIHSGGLIPAILWWKLIQKEVEKEIVEGTQERIKERKNVKNIAFKQH